MKKNYPKSQRKNAQWFSKALTIAVILVSFAFAPSAQAQGLVFKNPVFVSGQAGKPGAIYRFPQVTTNVDALVKINSRSSTKVKLKSIDLSNVGHDKAFQPQVTYDNDETPNGITDWWMEFEISFVNSNTTTPAAVATFDVTAIDIDGDGDDLNEWVSLYYLNTFIFESNTLLSSSGITEVISGVTTSVGKKFSGPTKNYVDVDTSGTRVMVSANYQNKNSFRLVAGGHSVGRSSAADRMYSFWFKSFAFQTPVQGSLPVKLSSFTAKENSGKVLLSWATEMEKNVSHFTIERSLDGTDFTDAGLIFTDGNSDTHREYNFTDDLKNVTSAVAYYRLRIVDLDGKYEKSTIRIVNLTALKEAMTISAYPNPVVNELRVTLPKAWQGNRVVIDILNINGQVVKHMVRTNAGQTETLMLNDLKGGLYMVRASNGLSTTSQRIVKSN